MIFNSELNKRFYTAPSIGDVDGDKNNEIVLIEGSGTVRALEGKTRREKWNFETEESTTIGRLALVDMNADGGMDVIYTSISGLLYVIDGKSGSQVGLFNLGDNILSTPIIYDLNRDKIIEIIASTYSGEIFSLQLDEKQKSFLTMKKSDWGMVNHDDKNTGYSSYYTPFLKRITFWN